MAAVDTHAAAAGGELPPEEFGYYLGRPAQPKLDMPLYSPYDQSLRLIGPMGSGKTFRFLGRVLRHAPGGALVASSKPDIYELTARRRARLGPVVTLDPQGVVPGQEPLRRSLVHGAHDTQVAEMRAKAMVTAGGTGEKADESASFYKGQAADLLACLLHAAALDGASLRDVLRWSRRPQDSAPRSILDHHPGAGPGWADILVGTVTGDERTVGNTLSTLARALSCFKHEAVIETVDVPQERATDIEGLIQAGGTIYLLGKDNPYSSVSPLVTAIAEDILDRAEQVAYTTPHRRLDPPFLCALDEVANTPLPSLRQRVADGRGRGIAVIYALQAWASAVKKFGRHDAAELAGYTNNVLVFGGVKEPDFLRDMERLSGKRRVLKVSTSSSRTRGERGSQSAQPDWEPTLPDWKIQRLDKDLGEALLLAGDLPPVITRLPMLTDDADWPQIQREVAEIRREADAAAERLSAERRAWISRNRSAWEAQQSGTGSVRMDKEGDL
ncbi:type IV secretory system conjugative DNA transfer family protein [Streptomyces chrestomyceticus]|uniref:type IV secretory system conjugative DNA transfer family protein n=1 Tax=Streptomyces chrestomyceticus TaxID=68185 RepID=UPI0033D6E76D